MIIMNDSETSCFYFRVIRLTHMKNIKKILKRSPLEVATIALVAIAFGYMGLPAAARATSVAFEPNEATKLEIAAIQNATKPFGAFPKAEARGPASTMYVQASAYNSVPWQTDSTPFTTASGTTVHFGTLAANFLPIGTMVKIPDYFGEQIFIVEDRMNPRYQRNVDIWMEEIPDAKAFGRRTVKIEIYHGTR